MVRAMVAMVLAGTLAASGAWAAGGKVSMVDAQDVEQGSAKVNLAKGSVTVKANLAPLPASVDTGSEVFDATIYKAYLTSSADPAIEVPLGSVYPNSKSKAAVKAKLKGDLSGLGLDRVLIVAFSKDGLSSFDVLTGTLAAQ